MYICLFLTAWNIDAVRALESVGLAGIIFTLLLSTIGLLKVKGKAWKIASIVTCFLSCKYQEILSLMSKSQQKLSAFSRLLKCLRSLYGKQCGPRTDCSYRSTLFAFILNLSVMLGNYFQQTTSADDIFRCIFSWRIKGELLFIQFNVCDFVQFHPSTIVEN